MTKLHSGLIIFLLSIFVLAFYLHPINLFPADLGRHVRNGEFALQDSRVLTTNFYSYTNPDFKATNHHWLFGVIIFWAWQAFGFSGVQIFFAALSLSVFLIFFDIARRFVGLGAAALVSFPAILLLSERTEIRPEVFSYLFAGIFLWILFEFRRGKLSTRWLFVLPLLEMLWANLHIYFFLGYAIAGTFLVEALLRRNKLTKPLLLITLVVAVATFATPFGIYSAMAPFTILREFGYSLAENQTIVGIQKLLPGNPNYIVFQIYFALLVLSFALSMFKKPAKLDLAVLFLTVGFSFLGWFQLRNMGIFGLISIVLISRNLASAFDGFRSNETSGKLNKLALAVLAVMAIIITSGNGPKAYAKLQPFGIGLARNNAKPAEFFLENKLSGPIFNNYDIGGYLIFFLFPRERVFLDNRPEAYPVSFFKEIYVPMQEDEKIWQTQAERYDFNAIFFSHRDYTPWGQKFLIARVQDPEWAPVYVDEYAIIFLRRSAANEPIIRQFEIPKDRFTVSGN